MTPDSRSSLVNKLTLLVLWLILVCLVLLVVRAYQKPLSPETAAVTVETTAPAEVEPEPIAPPPLKTNPPPRRPTLVNVPRSIVSSGHTPAPPPVPEPAPVETLQPVAQSTLVLNSAVTEIASGGGVQSVTGGSSTSGQPEIVGLVTLVGQPKPEVPIELGPSCGRINPNRVTTRHYVVGPGGGLANVLVYLKEPKPAPPIAEGPLLDQVGCMYEPLVFGVLAGQSFSVRNSDPELHNVHATPRINREFNFGQPLQGQVNQRSFAEPELFVRIKCDVHPWMFAYANVMRHPYFAITDTNGVFRIPVGFPAGTYHVFAHHLKEGGSIQKISINANERRALQFQFTLDSGHVASPPPPRP